MTSRLQRVWNNSQAAISQRHIDPPRSYVTFGSKLIRMLGVGFIRGLMKSCLSEVHGYGQFEYRQSNSLSSLLTFWHCNILMAVGNFIGYNARVLISEHGDGEAIAQPCLHLGIGVVRGSTTRGGARALVQLKRQLDEGYDVVVTPDGPKGPARQVQQGVIYLAAKASVPIFPMGVWSDSFKELSSWDRFRIPHPGSKIMISIGQPIHVPVQAMKQTDYWQEQVRLALELEQQRAKSLLSHMDPKGCRGAWSLNYLKSKEAKDHE